MPPPIELFVTQLVTDKLLLAINIVGVIIDNNLINNIRKRQ